MTWRFPFSHRLLSFRYQLSWDNVQNMYSSGNRLSRSIYRCSSLRARKPFYKSFKETCKIFCENTSLHGLKYVTGSEYHGSVGYLTLARVAWAVISLCGIVFALVMMQLSWVRFKNNPTITTIETTTHPIWNIPFPAVTVCNINKIDKSRTSHLMEQL